MKNGSIKSLLLVVVALTGFLVQGYGQSHLNLEEGTLALQGYDAVSYLVEKKAVEGKMEYNLIHEGATYLFSSLKNRELFKRTPQKYVSAYGGWCAYAMGATGEKVKVDPETFKIIDGQTYLFYNFNFTNTLKKWNKDEVALKKKGDSNWSKITKD